MSLEVATKGPVKGGKTIFNLIKEAGCTSVNMW